MSEGYFLIHRKLKHNPIYKNEKLLYLFIHLLMLANWQDGKVLVDGQAYPLARGQLITGRFKLAAETGLNPNTLKYLLGVLENLQIITLNSTNKFTLITLVKYGDYQIDLKKLPANYQQITSKLPQSNEDNKRNKINLDTKVSRGKALDKINPDVQKLWQYGITKGFEDRLQKKNRWAIKRLLGKFTVEQLCELVNLAVEVRPQKYAPEINSFIDLDYKLFKLRTFVEREGKKQTRTAVL